MRKGKGKGKEGNRKDVTKEKGEGENHGGINIG